MKKAHSLRVEAVVPQGSDAVLLCFAPEPDQRAAFRFQPGQYLTVSGGPDDNQQWRCYSITSAPDDSVVSVLVRRVAGGLVSNWLCDKVRAGHRLDVFPPAGSFTLRHPGQPAVLFAGGSGIAPVFTLARQALSDGAPMVSVFYANRNRATAMLMDELRALHTSFGARLQLRLWYDDSDGLPSAQDMAACMPAGAPTDVYLCGPDPFMQLVRQSLLEAGTDAGRIFCEEFAQAEPDRLPPAETANAVMTQLAVTLKGQRHHVAVRPGETLLTAMMAAKLPVPHACKVGECASCMCRVEQGSVEQLANSVLDEDDVADGWLLACRSYAVGDAVSVRFP